MRNPSEGLSARTKTDARNRKIMTTKPDWKAEFDEEKAELKMELVETFTGYSEAVVREALTEVLADEVRGQSRREFEEEYEE